MSDSPLADAFEAVVMEAIAVGMSGFMGRFECGPDLVVAVAHRTEAAVKELADSVVLNLRDGDSPGTQEEIAALARDQLAGPIAEAVASFVPGNNYVH